MPEIWRNPPKEALKAGHGGGDYFEVLDFLNAVRGTAPCPVGIHEAMDMTLPGLVSQQSILEGGRWLTVPDSREWTEAPPPPQLQMVWPERLLDSPPNVRLPEGYALRQYTDADEEAYGKLMAGAGFNGWDHDRIEGSRRGNLPGGLFVVEHKPTGALVATAMAGHHPSERHPEGGEVGWVAADPDHKGQGLGLAVCAAVVARFLNAGYRRIYLRTDDFRLPAIVTYMKLGFEPYLFTDGTEERWRAVCKQLGKPFEPRKEP
jgi:mycothiol synthase